MRKAMVTRTIESTRVNALCLDIKTAEPMNKEFNLSGTYKDESKLLKAVQKAFDTDDLKVVHIVDSEVVNTLYGMYENDFLANAMELDPETRKPISTADTDTEE